MQETKSKLVTKRRRLRFSLRSFFVMLIIAAVCIAPLAYEFHFYQKCVDLNAKARRHFSRLPGDRYVLYGNTVEQPFYRKWLEYPHRSDSYRIYAEDSEFGDEDLRSFVKYHRNAAGLDIRHADFRNSRITDAGLRCLQSLDQIRHVKVGYDPYIHGYCSCDLETPVILPSDPWPGSKITDRGLMYLSKISTLEEIWFYNTEISDEGLIHLSKLKRLKTLCISYHDDPLADPPAGSKITDAGIKYLSKLAQLKVLVVARTDISDNGLQELRNALPDCMVFGYEPACGWPIN